MLHAHTACLLLLWLLLLLLLLLLQLLSGDHLQLPPTVMSEAAAKAGLSNTLFERLQHSLGAAASCMLTVQYRMNAAIMDWSSQEMYGVSCC
jgi:superfamily I DNA and/or RNA helicase